MQKILKSTLTSILFFIATAPANADLKNSAIAMKSGNWKVLRSLDAMTDKVQCTGIYKENYSIQLAQDELYVSVSGGIQGVTLRFDEQSPLSMRLATKMEKEIRSVIISGTEFTQLTQSKRLRLQVSTLVSGLHNDDLDLTGLNEALQSISTNCPVVPPPEKAIEKVEQKASSPQLTCSEMLITKMKKQGLKEKQIRAICD